MSLAILSSVVLLAPAVSSLVLPDDVGRLPALGWNSWNAYHCDVSEDKIIAAANSVIDLGLKDAGYEYVNIDDCWSVQAGRDTTTNQIIPNGTTFPDGISGTADKVHDLGLKLGIYSSAGTATCAGYPASLDYEDIDAASFAAWGIDYLKYDNCNFPAIWDDQYQWCIQDRSSDVGPNGTCLDITNPAPPGYNWSTSNSTRRYNRMRDALLAQNRTIQFSMCIWGTADVESWANGTGSSYRMSDDIQPEWSRIMIILNEASFIMNYVGFWDHADTDMLEVGNGLTTLEERSHFGLWALMKSPLIIGTDLSLLSTDQVNLLKNPYLLAFNQDPVYGAPAAPYKWGTNPDWSWNQTFPAEYWAGEFSNGTIIAMLNTGNDTVNKIADFGEVPGLKKGVSYDLTDIWTGDSLGKHRNSYTDSVDSHDTAIILVQQDTSNRGGSGWSNWWNWWTSSVSRHGI